MWQEYRVKSLQTDQVTVGLASEIARMSEVNQSLGLGLGLGGEVQSSVAIPYVPISYLCRW